MRRGIAEHLFLAAAKSRRQTVGEETDAMLVAGDARSIERVAEEIRCVVGGIADQSVWVDCAPLSGVIGQNILMVEVAVKRHDIRLRREQITGDGARPCDVVRMRGGHRHSFVNQRCEMSFERHEALRNRQR